MKHAGAEVEAVEDDVEGDGDRGDAEPDEFHQRDVRAGPCAISRDTSHRNRIPSTQYNPANPSSVKSVVPLCTVGDAPSRVRISPYTSHGCRPNSAVIQPAVFAMNGNGTASTSAQSMGRITFSQPRQSSAVAIAITAMKSVPRPTMM